MVILGPESRVSVLNLITKTVFSFAPPPFPSVTGGGSPRTILRSESSWLVHGGGSRGVLVESLVLYAVALNAK